MKTMRVVTLSRIIWVILILLLLTGLCLVFSLFNKKTQNLPVEPVTTDDVKIINYTDSKKIRVDFNQELLNNDEIDIKNNVITLKESASYELSGNNDGYQIVIDAPNSVVKIVFDQFASSQTEELLMVKSANKVVLNVAEDTVNTINDSAAENANDKYIINSNSDIEIEGTGTLNIHSLNKFLNVKGNLNYKDAIIQVSGLDKALTIEKNLKFDGGILYTGTTSEAIVCNGNLEINAGKLIATSENQKAIVVKGIFLINNGEIIIASNKEIQKPNANSLQNSLIFNFVNNTDKLLVLHNTQKIVLAYQNEFSFSHFLYSNLNLANDNYILYGGGKVSGVSTYGVYEAQDYMEDYQLTSPQAENDTFNARELINIYNDVAKK